jgi:hypothetical protein
MSFVAVQYNPSCVAMQHFLESFFQPAPGESLSGVGEGDQMLDLKADTGPRAGAGVSGGWHEQSHNGQLRLY